MRAAIIEVRHELPHGVHNLVRLAEILGVDDEEVLECLRSPDAVNGVPSEVYSKAIAEELVGAAERW